MKNNTSQNIESKSENIFNKEISLQGGFTDKKKESFYNELAALLEAGIDIRKSLTILIAGLPKKKDQSLITSLKEKITKGKSLNESMKELDVFSPYEYYSIKIGEETGKLVLVLKELQKFFNQKLKLKRQLISVLSYPIFIFFVTIGVLYFMLGSVVPMFSDVFSQFGNELPVLTQKIVSLSNNIGIIMAIFTIVVVSLLIIGFTQKKELWYRKLTSQIILKIPVFGKIIQKVYLSRFCQSLSLLTAAHTPLVQALDLIKNMISFYPLEVAIEEIREDVLKGKLFSESMANHSIFPQKLTSLVAASEEINDLETMFKRLSDQYQNDLDHQTKIIGKILDPLMMLMIGGIVALVMIAMYLPMFSMSQILE